jgi:hypothetical protein
MRRYDVVSGIFFILSIIDFTLAAPVLVQEKRQAGVHVVHMPKDVVPVLGKRAGEELEKSLAEFFKTWETPIGSSDAHVSSSSAPPEPGHGPTNVMQEPAPNPASLTANPDPLSRPSSPSSIPPPPGSEEDRFNAWDTVFSHKKSGYQSSEGLTFTPESSGYGSDQEWATAYSSKQYPNPDPELSTAPGPGADPEFDWNYWMSLEDPASPKKIGLAPENQAGHVPQPDQRPSAGADPNFDWEYWMNLDRPASPKETGPVAWGIPTSEAHQPPPSGYYPLSSTEFGQDHGVNPPPSPTDLHSYLLSNPWLSTGPEHEVVTPPSTGAGSTTVPEHEVATPPSPDLGPPKEPENEVVHGPPTTPGSADPELPSDYQPLSEDSFKAAIYAAKGKAKQSRRISGTARDVGSVAQRELQHAERSLDPREYVSFSSLTLLPTLKHTF